MVLMLKNLLHKGPVLFDGAMGTRLVAMGLAAGHPPEEWNLSHPKIVAEVHREYISAGSDMIETNTFGANRLRLARHDLTGKLETINREGTRLALKEAGEKTLVAASIGPTGEFLEPYGDLSEEEAFRVFLEQVKILREEGTAVFHLETFGSTQEALCALKAVEEVSGEAIVSFTYEAGRGGDLTTIFGETPEKVAAVFKKKNIAGLGANCGTGTSEMLEIMRRYRPVAGCTLSCRPNAGKPHPQGEKVTYPETPGDFYGAAKEFLKIGVSILGGCCGTDGRFIAEIAKAMGR